MNMSKAYSCHLFCTYSGK